MKNKYATITNEKLDDIIYDTLCSLENDLDSGEDLTLKEIENAKASINWYVVVLKDKLSDYFEFESEVK